MTARWITADVFDGLATLEDGSVDLIISSPPFLALRSYLPADHPDKHKEIGSEATPAEFIDVLLKVTAELRRVLAPHGSICVELGDTYSGSGESGWERDKGDYRRENRSTASANGQLEQRRNLSSGWPLSKSRTLIPQLYEIALAYGINPLTGSSSPAGQWRIRNVVTWARPNPPVGALGDKWRPATSDLIVACTSGKRYWDDLATRRSTDTMGQSYRPGRVPIQDHNPSHGWADRGPTSENPSGAPLLDYWEIPPGGYKGSHYAVFPEELVVPCIRAMCPEKVCRICGEPSRRIVTVPDDYAEKSVRFDHGEGYDRDRMGTHYTDNRPMNALKREMGITAKPSIDMGWTDCGHDDYRPGLILDPFAGSGTTLSVATGHGHDAIGIDLDPRNADLARDRIGPFLFEETRMQ